MPPFSFPPLPQSSPSPTGSSSAFPAELQMQSPSPAAGDKFEDLLQRIQGFNENANQLQTQIIMNKQIGESDRVAMIVKALEILQTLGVNPADPQAIAKFLMKLEEENPDMAEMAKKTLYGIFGGEPVPETATEPQQGALPPPPAPEGALQEPQF